MDSQGGFGAPQFGVASVRPPTTSQARFGTTNTPHSHVDVTMAREDSSKPSSSLTLFASTPPQNEPFAQYTTTTGSSMIGLILPGLSPFFKYSGRYGPTPTIGQLSASQPIPPFTNPEMLQRRVDKHFAEHAARQAGLPAGLSLVPVPKVPPFQIYATPLSLKAIPAPPSSKPTRTVYLPVKLTADDKVKPEIVSFAQVLGGHTLRKASILRAAELDYTSQFEPSTATLFGPMPWEVEHAAEKVFSKFYAQTATDARFYLRPDASCANVSMPIFTKSRQRARKEEQNAILQPMRHADWETVQSSMATEAAEEQFVVEEVESEPSVGIPEGPAYSSRLTSLPPELINQIYGLVLLQDTPVELNTTIETAKPPSLLAVCRKFRQEALPMYYSGNDFSATVHNANTAYICLWLDAVGPKSGCHIRRIILQCDGRIAEGFGGDEDAAGHYFAAVIRCLIASSVCYGAVEFRHSAMPDYVPGQEFDHSSPSHGISHNRGDRFAAYMFLHWEAPRYVDIAGYDSSSRCNRCRGLLHRCRGLFHRQNQNVAPGHVFGPEARVRAWAALPLPHFVPDQQDQERRLWEAQVQLVEQYLAIIRKKQVRQDETVDSKFKFDFGVVAALKWCRLQSGAGETKSASTWLNKVPGEFEVRVRAALKSK